MRSEDASDFGPLTDIAENIELAFGFAPYQTIEEFQADRKAIYAVTRCCEIISEASRRLSPELKQRHPEIDWKQIAGAGNVYRHDYLDVRDDILWMTLRNFLPALASVVRQELARLTPS